MPTSDTVRTVRPTGLTVLYDANCPVCRRARRWVERHRHLIPIRFVPAGSALAARRFPDLDAGSTLAEVTVVTDEGAVLRGDKAWISVLWAVARTRAFAIRLTSGRGTWRLHSVQGATEAIRSLSAGQRDHREPTMSTGMSGDPAWPPPGAAVATDSTCSNCRT